MSAFQKDWSTRKSPEETPSINGLTIDELNRYLPALQHITDIKAGRENLQEGVFQTDALTGLSHLPEGKIDLIVVRPPENPIRDLNATGSDTTWQDLYDWHRQWLEECRRVLKPSGFIFVFCSWPHSGMYQSLLANRFYIRTRITWRRPHPSQEPAPSFLQEQSGDIWVGTVSRETRLRSEEALPGSNFWSDVVDWRMGRETGQRRIIPEQVLERIIRMSTTKLDWVVDPFMGAGQTGVVTKKMGRRFIGFDRDQDQCLLAMKRIDQA